MITKAHRDAPADAGSAFLITESAAQQWHAGDGASAPLQRRA